MKYLKLLSILALISCSHDEQIDLMIHFHGHVFNYFTKTPYPDTKVVLHLGTGLNDLNNNSFQNERLDSVYTDGNGEYYFLVDKENFTSYKLITEKPGYMQAVDPRFIARTINSNQMTDSLFLGTSTTVKLVITNDSPADGDQISVVITYATPYDILFYSREILSTSIIERMGYDPNSFRTTRKYFYDINTSIHIDISITRYNTGVPVTTTQSNSYT
jgi:hypothetical protein